MLVIGKVGLSEALMGLARAGQARRVAAPVSLQRLKGSHKIECSLSSAVPPPSAVASKKMQSADLSSTISGLLMVLTSRACHNATRAEKFSATDPICAFESAAETTGQQ
jgi:hypothetical protein